MPEHAEQLNALKAVLAERYGVERELGRGGMATVYLAEDLKHHRQVAIKVLKPELARALGAERFLREIEIAARLHHPHILPLYDSGEADGFLYYVMPYVEGESLRDRLNRETQLPVDDAVQIAREVADALGSAHSHDVVHRDIKPENILLEEGHAVVADFGIARAIHAAGGEKLTETGVAVGTPAYMSPEQITGEQLDGRSDVYSVGCVLYETLTGEPPFAGRTAQAIMSRRMTEPTPSLRTVRETVPGSLDQVVKRALAKLPADRFATAGQLAEALAGVETAPRGAAASVAVEPKRKRPLMAYAAVAIVVVVGAYTVISRTVGPPESAAAAERPRLAVLPFDNLGSSEDDYFADGITEEVTSRIAEISGLLVISRTSAMQYRSNTKPPLRQIGEELDVDYVLEGTIRTDRAVDGSGQVRVTPQLIRVSDDAHLWTARYTASLIPGEIFDVQEQIATQVARALDITLLEPERQRLAARPTGNQEAYRLYLEGRFFWNQRTKEAMERAIELFELALQYDPDYALAYGGLADAYNMLGDYSYLPPLQAYPKGREAARRALEIDSTLAEAYVALAEVHRFEYDWNGAQRAFEQAIALNPNYATAYQWYANVFRDFGRVDTALTLMRRALELDPRSLIINRAMGRVLLVQRDYDGAIRQLRATLEMGPRFIPAHRTLGLAYVHKSMYEEAIAQFRTAAALSANDPRDIAYLGYAYGMSGQRAEARRMLDSLLAMERYVEPVSVAKVYLGLGDKDRAFHWLERAYEERSAELAFLFTWPMYDGVRSDPRAVDLLRRMKFPEQPAKYGGQ